ncbi:MAG: adenosylmethionine decarboxylase [Phycisphaeraceae bacterium]|nr:adenosylmethionine decarboxylase [Phycisphaeraceae bacterium]
MQRSRAAARRQKVTRLHSIARHVIVDLYGCPRELIDDVEFVRATLVEAAQRSISTLLQEVSHRFEPQGVTVVGLLAESHISIHTWPEHQYVAADILTCGEDADPDEACRYLAQRFESIEHETRHLDRGGKLAPVMK